MTPYRTLYPFKIQCKQANIREAEVIFSWFVVGRCIYCENDGGSSSMLWRCFLYIIFFCFSEKSFALNTLT